MKRKRSTSRIVAMIWLLTTLAGFLATAQPIPPGTDIEVPDPENWAMLRMCLDVQKTDRWQNAKTNVERLAAMRSYVEDLKPEGGGTISDRYIVTAYAGAVDMRHFLYTAIKVLTEEGSRNYWRGSRYSACNINDAWKTFNVSDAILKAGGKQDLHIQRALYDTFCVEKGPVFEKSKVEDPVRHEMRIAERFWDATPEDFPSSALGALFAQYYLKDRVDDLSADLVMEFTRFILPFRPVPDQIRNKLLYREFVKGFKREKADEPLTKEEEDRLFIHFTALPLNNTRLINKVAEEIGFGTFCEDVDAPEEALAKAGVKLEQVAFRYPLRLVYIDPSWRLPMAPAEK